MRTNTRLTAAVEVLCAGLGRVCASGCARSGRSRHVWLANLLNAVGAVCRLSRLTV